MAEISLAISAFFASVLASASDLLYSRPKPSFRCSDQGLDLRFLPLPRLFHGAHIPTELPAIYGYLCCSRILLPARSVELGPSGPYVRIWEASDRALGGSRAALVERFWPTGVDSQCEQPFHPITGSLPRNAFHGNHMSDRRSAGRSLAEESFSAPAPGRRTEQRG
jgi:hypothetical protein